MNDRHAQLLAEACASAARDVPKLQRSLREKPEESAASITKEIEDFLGAVRDDRKAVQAGAEKTLHPLMLLFDVALLQVCDLSLFGLQNIDHPRKVVWPNEVFPARPRPNAVFYILTANIAHSMQAYRMLVLQGFESQARATFRSVVEVFDLMLVVLASPDKYREYITSFEDPKDAYRHWKRCLSPAKIRDVLDNLEIADPVSLPIDHSPKELRHETYSWLSRFVHVDFAAHVVMAHPTAADGHSAPIAMLGAVGETTRATLAHSLMYLWLSLTRLDRPLWSKHGWGTFRGSGSRRWYGYRSRALNHLCESYLPAFWEGER